MAKELKTMRIWKETWQKLRIVAALTDRSLVQVLDDLLTLELKRFRESDD